MISEIALLHFDELWRLFEVRLLDARGSMFLIDPVREFFPKSFADGLTSEHLKLITSNAKCPLLDWEDPIVLIRLSR